MSSDELRTPDPGTAEAQMIGCLCPVADNHYGDGIDDGHGGKMYWYNGNCPLHAERGNIHENGRDQPTDEPPTN